MASRVTPQAAPRARSELYHVCIVVPALEAARAHLTELLGVQWGPSMTFEFGYIEADGTAATVPNFSLCYSLAAPFLELVEERPGTPWVCNDHSNVHHLGFFVDGMDSGSEHLEATACPLGAHQRDPQTGALSWAYHRDRLGFQIEIVDVAGAAMTSQVMLQGVPIDAPASVAF